MRKGICIGFCVALMVVVAALSGCRQATSYNKTQYILDPNRATEPVMASKDGVLEVRRFTIDSAFAGKNLLYRTGELEYEAEGGIQVRLSLTKPGKGQGQPADALDGSAARRHE